MRLDESLLAQMETPCLVIDVEQAHRNISAMQSAADAAGCALRPHVKTHKMPLFARMQIEAGARGITCAKVSEAEVMASAGIDDIFIAYPMVGRYRIERALVLQKKVSRLLLAVDSLPGAAALNEAAKQTGAVLEVRLEIDTGAGRTGVALEDALHLARAVEAMPALKLEGIYTFKSLVYRGKPTVDLELAAREEGEMMAQVGAEFRCAGIAIETISAGSSPTGIAVAMTGLVNEIRPGTYVFNDLMLCAEGVARREEIAARFVATVVSTLHPGYAVIDGGTKMFPTDVQPGSAPVFLDGYAMVEGRDDLSLARMNEEHGMLVAKSGETKLQVGDVLTLIPVHVCTAINMQNSVYLLENGQLRRQAVEARGRVV